jgi:hypothetical protein
MAIAQLEGAEAQRVAQALATGRDHELADAVRQGKSLATTREEEEG